MRGDYGGQNNRLRSRIPTPNPELNGGIEMMYPAGPGTLKVPGATVYYEVRGSGPLLVMIPGGPADAGVMADLARKLADRYTVVAYDPRGNARSTVHGAPKDQQIDIHGDDAMRLIEALSDEPAYVFGTSGGGLIGLNLSGRYPGRVRALVAHEPPCVDMPADSAAAWAMIGQVFDSYSREGVRGRNADIL
jgi:pimeloyl-ACP methyl ester carboxylesterase